MAMEIQGLDGRQERMVQQIGIGSQSGPHQNLYAGVTSASRGDVVLPRRRLEDYSGSTNSSSVGNGLRSPAGPITLEDILRAPGDVSLFKFGNITGARLQRPALSRRFIDSVSGALQNGATAISGLVASVRGLFADALKNPGGVPEDESLLEALRVAHHDENHAGVMDQVSPDAEVGTDTSTATDDDTDGATVLEPSPLGSRRLHMPRNHGNLARVAVFAGALSALGVAALMRDSIGDALGKIGNIFGRQSGAPTQVISAEDLARMQASPVAGGEPVASAVPIVVAQAPAVAAQALVAKADLKSPDDKSVAPPPTVESKRPVIARFLKNSVEPKRMETLAKCLNVDCNDAQLQWIQTALTTGHAKTVWEAAEQAGIDFKEVENRSQLMWYLLSSIELDNTELAGPDNAEQFRNLRDLLMKKYPGFADLFGGIETLEQLLATNFDPDDRDYDSNRPETESEFSKKLKRFAVAQLVLMSKSGEKRAEAVEALSHAKKAA